MIQFFFVMLRRPPRSPPFPTRRSSDLHDQGLGGSGVDRQHHPRPHLADGPDDVARAGVAGAVHGSELEPEARSEEHTSELQSQSNLVCRLLLEKKKKNKQRIYDLNVVP